MLGGLNSGAERRLFVSLCLLAPWVRLLVRLPPVWLSRVLMGLARPVTPRSAIAPERVAHIVGLAQSLGHPLVRPGCLTRGVALFWILRRRGVDVDLVFGIGGPEDEYQGHCWLTRNGELYLEKQAFGDRFVELFRIPAVVAVT
jgi:hypothetical protein